MRVVAHCVVGLVGVVCLSFAAMAQPAPSTGGTVEFGDKGIVFHTADSSSKVRMQFRIQAMSTYSTRSMSDFSVSSLNSGIRRARIKFQGHLFDPRLTYKVEIGFSRRDISFGALEYPNAMLDGVAYWNFSKDFKLGAGQTKLPGNRQRVVSSSEMEFADRTNVNSAFNIDRDAGLFAFWKPVNNDDVVLQLAGALTSGDGRNVPSFDESGVSVTGRVEFLPFGKFAKKNDYVESDQFREPKPKLSLGLSVNHNDQMVRNRGQLGTLLFAPRTATVVYGDGLLKWNGWAIYGEYAQRAAENPVTVNADDPEESNAVFVGNGYLLQASYTFPFKLAIAGRVGIVTAGDQLAGRREHARTTLIATGLSYYLKGHRVKGQLEFANIRTEDLAGSRDVAGFFYTRLNIEVGI